MCPIDGYIDTVFAVDGDVTAIPDATQGSGTVSYQQGFPVGYSTPQGSGGFNFPRYQFNQLMNDITTVCQNWQQKAYPPFITSTMNGGTPYSYSKFNTCYEGGVVYISLVNSNTDTPPSSKWAIVPLGQSSFWCSTSTGAANVQAISTGLGLAAFTAGQSFNFIAGYTNTNTMTLAIDTISAVDLYVNGASGPVTAPAGTVIAGNGYTAEWDGTYLILINPFAATSTFLLKANNLSDVANTTTSRTNIGAAASGANTDITSLQGSALIVTPLGVGSMVTATCTSNPAAGSAVSASTLTACCSDESGTPTGDTLTGTYKAEQTYISGYCVSFQRTL